MLEPKLLPVHYHGDGRRALSRFINGPAVRQVYMIDVRPGVTTCWHGHSQQTDYWVVLDGMLQVACAPFDNVEKVSEFWLNGAYQQVLTIPPGYWHGYHNAGPVMVRMLNLTTEPYTDHPDELRLSDGSIRFTWGRVEVK